MPAVARYGDVCGGGIIAGASTVLTNGRPSSTAGDLVAPHDSKPTHFAVTTSTNPKVLIQGVPVTRVGDFDTCFHPRITGSANVLT